MKKDFSDTDRLDEIRDHFENYSDYNEYNNAESDRYETKTNNRYIDYDYDYFDNLERERNINRQNSYFSKNSNDEYDYYDKPVKKRGGCGGFLFGCCLGVVIILAIMAAFVAVSFGGIGTIAYFIYQLF
ncbi:MAG: hypothetical protein Q4P34_01180 [Tissierellia bacterium]|nr:hypothetical protein [Tissierellia bacterium]